MSEIIDSYLVNKLCFTFSARYSRYLRVFSTRSQTLVGKNFVDLVDKLQT